MKTEKDTWQPIGSVAARILAQIEENRRALREQQTRPVKQEAAE